MESNKNQRVLLAVLAHPDDESFGMGGTLAKYAEDGIDVHLVCATRGEAGEVDPEYLEGFSSIGQLRESELFCAVEKLGIEEVHLLDYRDSGMSGSADNNKPEALVNAPLNQVAEEIAEIIRRIKPPHSPGKLYYHTISRHFIRFNVQLLRLLGKDPTRYGKNKDIDLTQLAGDDFPIHARIDYSTIKEKKDAAAACHASQGGEGLTRGFIRWLTWLLRVKPEDQFMQAFPEPDQDIVKYDLFD